MEDQTIIITRERPDTEEAWALIAEMEAYLAPLYPPSSQHGLSVEEMIAEEVAFFMVRFNGQVAGCGGVKCFEKEYAEIKRIYVRPFSRGKGLGKRILNHLEAYADQQGITVLRLETGIFQPEAIGLYEKLGYRPIAPFGKYWQDPLSLFYEKCIR